MSHAPCTMHACKSSLVLKISPKLASGYVPRYGPLIISCFVKGLQFDFRIIKRFIICFSYMKIRYIKRVLYIILIFHFVLKYGIISLWQQKRKFKNLKFFSFGRRGKARSLTTCILCFAIDFNLI